MESTFLLLKQTPPCPVSAGPKTTSFLTPFTHSASAELAHGTIKAVVPYCTNLFCPGAPLAILFREVPSGENPRNLFVTVLCERGCAHESTEHAARSAGTRCARSICSVNVVTDACRSLPAHPCRALSCSVGFLVHTSGAVDKAKRRVYTPRPSRRGTLFGTANVITRDLTSGPNRRCERALPTPGTDSTYLESGGTAPTWHRVVEAAGAVARRRQGGETAQRR